VKKVRAVILSRRNARGILLGALLAQVGGLAEAAAPRAQAEARRALPTKESPYPVEGRAPRETTAGLVSIPGNPLPALPKESVQNAIPIYEAILSVWRLSGETPSLARGLGYLASLYVAVGDAAKAERLYDEAQRILEKHGATGRDLGWVNNNRGLARLDQERYAEALSSFRAAARAL
jgi:tetratricopeptide (TPR) repeat protein